MEAQPEATAQRFSHELTESERAAGAVACVAVALIAVHQSGPLSLMSLPAVIYAVSFAAPLLAWGINLAGERQRTEALVAIAGAATVITAVVSAVTGALARFALTLRVGAFALVVVAPALLGYLGHAVAGVLVEAVRVLSVPLAVAAPFLGIAIFVVLLVPALRSIVAAAFIASGRILKGILVVILGRARARLVSDVPGLLHLLIAGLLTLAFAFLAWLVFGVAAPAELAAAQTADGPKGAKSLIRAAEASRRSAGWLRQIAERFASGAGRDTTDEGQPIYTSKSGAIAAAWQVRTGKSLALQTIAFEPNIKDQPTILLARLVNASTEAVITDAVRHGNQDRGRMPTRGPIEGEGDEGPAPTPVAEGTKAVVRVAVVQGASPNQSPPPADTKLIWVLDVEPAVTNNILRRISKENLADNISRRVGRSPKWVTDRLEVDDDQAADYLSDVLGISVDGKVMSFALQPATSAQDDYTSSNDMPW